MISRLHEHVATPANTCELATGIVTSLLQSITILILMHILFQLKVTMIISTIYTTVQMTGVGGVATEPCRQSYLGL